MHRDSDYEYGDDDDSLEIGAVGKETMRRVIVVVVAR